MKRFDNQAVVVTGGGGCIGGATCPARLMRGMGEMGFIAPELPETCGGRGTGCLAAGVIHEEIALMEPFTR